MHDELISQILKEEEEVLKQHRQHIDSMYRSSKIVRPAHAGSQDDPGGRQARQ
jgi:hypothetical protein